MKKRKFTAKFKTKVVLETLKEVSTLAELAQKYKLAPSQISTWKKDFLSGAEQVFEKGKGGKTEEEKEKDKLLRTIGELKVENDFLKKSLL
jgi:transposase